MKSHQLINQTSGDTEYYTDPRFTAAASLLMGGIDLDPASSVAANRWVKAKNIYTKEDNGLTHAWYGTVWLNHPFSKGEKVCKASCRRKTCTKRGHHCTKEVPSNAKWINRLISEFQSGNVKRFCCITFACTSERWFQPLQDFPQVYLYPRTNYFLPSGKVKKGVTKGSVITFGGSEPQLIRHYFGTFGKIKWPDRDHF